MIPNFYIVFFNTFFSTLSLSQIIKLNMKLSRITPRKFNKGIFLYLGYVLLHINKTLRMINQLSTQ